MPNKGELHRAADALEDEFTQMRNAMLKKARRGFDQQPPEKRILYREPYAGLMGMKLLCPVSLPLKSSLAYRPPRGHNSHVSCAGACVLRGDKHEMRHTPCGF